MRNQWFTKEDKVYDTAGSFLDFGVFWIFLREIYSGDMALGVVKLETEHMDVFTLCQPARL